MAADQLDPCGEYGPTQRWAFVWFFAAISIGLGAILTLKNTDYYNYTHNGEFFDYKAYRSNRVGQLGMQSDGVDERAHGDLGTAERKAAGN